MLSWILQLSKFATPLEETKTPPPCKPKSGARNVPSGRWRTCQGRFKMQTLTYCSAKITSTRTAVGQFKGQFNGRWKKRLGRFKMQALTLCDAEFKSTRTTAGQFKSQFKGAMEDKSGKVQKANTHILRCRNHKHAHSSRSVQGSVQWGDG